MNPASLKLVADGGQTLRKQAHADAALSVRGMTVSYGGKPAVFSIDATFPKGSMTAIVGPNGAGKSTLLKAVLGIVSRLSGQVTVFGRTASPRRGRGSPTSRSAPRSIGIFRRACSTW